MENNSRIQTGVPGFDQIVSGGLPAAATYLVKGQPGTGKTTMGLQFLVEGARRGEKCLFICLAETRGQLAGIARAYGLSLDGIDVHEMRRPGGASEAAEPAGYTVFSPAEVELEEISRELVQQLERFRPSRLVLDSLSEIRMLAADPFRFRRQLLMLCDHIDRYKCTALLIDVESEASEIGVTETLVSGVVHLEQLSPAYGGSRRRLQVRKLRASRSSGGYHDFAIRDRGMEVFPRVVAAPHRADHSSASVKSGLKELDEMLGGGLDGGTSTLLVGPAGTGKSTVAAHFLSAAAARGERAAMLCFDESPTNLLLRANGLRIHLAGYVDNRQVQLQAIDPAEYSPGELSQRISTFASEGARVIVLDSLNGYLNSMPEERFLSAHLHELLAFLSEKGVATILTLAHHGMFGDSEGSLRMTYIADAVILFRYFEAAGEVRKALSVIKKRTGNHEQSIRELRFGPGGLEIGPPLTMFRGILSEHPVEFDGGAAPGGSGEPGR